MNIAARLALANLLFVQGNHASALERQVRQACMHSVHIYLHGHACVECVCQCLGICICFPQSNIPTATCKAATHQTQAFTSLQLTSFLPSQKILQHHGTCGQPVLLQICRYQEAIRLHPGCPAEVRLGLAACYFRLGQLERAKKAYERVVQLSPTCAEALYGLAVLRFSSSQGESAKAVSTRPCFCPATCSPVHTTCCKH